MSSNQQIYIYIFLPLSRATSNANQSDQTETESESLCLNVFDRHSSKRRRHVRSQKRYVVARRSKPVNFRCTDRGCRGILKRGCTPAYRQGVVEICHTSREQTWCPVTNGIEFLLDYYASLRINIDEFFLTFLKSKSWFEN